MPRAALCRAMPFCFQQPLFWLSADHCPHAGVRVGEADNPGPPCHSSQPTLHSFWSGTGHTPPQLSMAVANPTAVLGKSSELLALGAQVLFLAETSAVDTTQHSLSCQLRPAGYRCHWSAPVAPHFSEEGKQASRRGCAGGAAVITSLASHRSFEPWPEALWATQRVAEAIIRVGGMAFRAICVYGFPANHADAPFKNQALFSQLFARVQLGRLPFVIAGDFNCEVSALPCWRSFQDAGCHELHALFKARCGEALPCTCRGATAWDSAILCPIMTSLWRGAMVDEDTHMFDAHSPLHYHFSVPTLPPAVQRWRLPVSWATLKPPPGLVAKHYARLAHADRPQEHELSSGFQCWARHWEQAVHLALKEAQQDDPVAFPCPGLGRQHRGRCKPRVKKMQTVPTVPKLGGDGELDSTSQST